MPAFSYPVAAISVISGISNAVLIAVINAAAETVANKEMNWMYLVLYLVGFLFFIFSKRYVLDKSAETANWMVSGIRRRLADMVRKTELATLEKHGASSIYTGISQDAAILSGAAVPIVNGLQSAVMIFFILFYIATLSVWSFGVIVLGMVIAIFTYKKYALSFSRMWINLSRKETEFFGKVEHILKGFNEISINRRKNEHVFSAFSAVNNEVRKFRVVTGKRYNIILSFLEVAQYLLLGLVLFGLPNLHAGHAEITIKVVAALLFMAGPLENIIYSVPGLASANNSARNIMDLEAQLKEELEKMPGPKMDSDSPFVYQPLPFKSQIAIKSIAYQYSARSGNGKGFRVGPIDLTVRRGELIFITGGNGSGKSTFLKLFTGLYWPEKGQILLDGDDGQKQELVTLYNRQQYQNLFAAIFSNYHLFDKVYGVDREIDPLQANLLLASLGLPERKVKYEDGAFTNIRLSSGQKKRLALATTLLEDKPIYIFDEVAADLDPAFRDVFYFELLPELKARNKVVLVVSHDQQYWGISDRLVHFQEGKLTELSQDEVHSLVQMASKY